MSARKRSQRKLITMCCLLSLLLGVGAFPVLAAGTAPVDGQSISDDALQNGQLYYIQTKTDTGKPNGVSRYLSVFSDNNGVGVVQSGFTGADTQKWRLIALGGGYYELQAAVGTGTRLLDVRYGDSSNFNTLDIYDSNNTNSQKFKITYNKDSQTYTILTGLDSAKSLDFYAGSNDDGQSLELYNSNSTSAQQFVLKSANDITQGTMRVTSQNDLSSGAAYYIRPIISGLYLTAKDGGDDNGTPISQEEYDPTAAQQWILTDAGDGSYYITSVGSFTKRHIDVPAGSSSDWLRLQLYSQNQTSAQRYKVTFHSDGTVSLMTGSSNYSKCVDIPYASTSVGVSMQQYSYNGTAAQRFQLEKLTSTLNTKPIDSPDSIVSGNSYYIQSAYSKLFLSPDGSPSADGTGIVQNYRVGSVAQRWTLSKNSDNTYVITNTQSGKALDVQYACNIDGAKVQLYTSNGTNAQKWVVEKNSDGTFRITSGAYLNPVSPTNDLSHKRLDINGMDSRPDEIIHLWGTNDAVNQEWYLIPVSGGQSATTDPTVSLQSANGSTMKASDTFTGSATNQSGVKDVALYLDSPLSNGFLGYANIGNNSSQSRMSVSYSLPCSFADAQLSMGAHTIYAVATGYDGTTQTTAIQLAPPVTVNSLPSSNITDTLSFGGSFSADGTGVSVYINSVDADHKLGDATVDSGSHTYTFSASGLLARAQFGTNEIILVETDAAGQEIGRASFPLNFPQPKIGIASPADNSNITDGKTLNLTGYAVNYTSKPQNVDIYIDGNKVNPVAVSGTNPDKTDDFSAYPDAANSGFSTTLDVSSYSSGTHTLQVQFTGDKSTTVSQTIHFNIPQVIYRPFDITFADLLQDQIKYENTERAKNGDPPLTDAEISNFSVAMNPNSYSSDQYKSIAPITKYEFMNLNWIDGVTANDLNGMLTNSGNLSGRGQDFLDAAKTYNINPVYLVAHANLETGFGGTTKFSRLVNGIAFENGQEYYYTDITQKSKLPVTHTVKQDGNNVQVQVTGTLVSGTTYCYTNSFGTRYNIADGTYYNLWGINANDEVASWNGGIWAGYSGWNTIGASIAGGAQWIAAHYTTGHTYAQTTLYEMKWDPYGWATYGNVAEYATDFDSITDNWAYNVAQIIAEHDDIFQHTAPPTFHIPQYN